VNKAINIGIIDNTNQFSLINLIDGKLNEKVVSTEDLEKQHLHALFYKKEILEVNDINEILNKSQNFYPLTSLEDISSSKEEFIKKSFEEAYTLYENSLESWRLQNNVILLETLFEHADHLKNLWPNDRTAFFEELWFILKRNLGASEIKIVYNDIKKASAKSDRNELIQVTIEGNKHPNPKEGGDFEKSLMDQFAEEFAVPFNVSEFNEEKGQLVLTAVVNDSPMIIMAEVPSFSRVQSAVVSAFMNSLSR
tara:strand:+ start:1031 stop:1786 length:756 start_codon:yes stop_codon:yes gene_type:complete